MKRSGGKYSWREDRQCKGPEARRSSECWGNSRAASVAELHEQGAGGRGGRGEEGRLARRQCQTVQGFVGYGEDFGFYSGEWEAPEGYNGGGVI